jgi:L-aminopeptidase/D-esterase-like protein
MPATGDWHRFQTVHLGSVTLTAGGGHVVRARPGETWNALNLESIRLVPRPPGATTWMELTQTSDGSVMMPGTKAFWAWPFEQDGEFGGVRPPADYTLDLDDWGGAKSNPGMWNAAPASGGRTNTTICCVATNVTLTPPEAQRVAKMAIAGLGRAVRPAFAPFDGDVVFCLSTGQVERTELRPFVIARIGELAAGCLARAIARGVYAARV